MENLCNIFLEDIFREMEMDTYPLGDELSNALYGGNSGIPYFKILFNIPGMSNRIFELATEIKEFNYKNKHGMFDDDELEHLTKKRDIIISDIRRSGLLVNWDILDNLWDKLPGDN